MANDDVYENASPPLLATQRSPAPPPPPPPPAGVKSMAANQVISWSDGASFVLATDDLS